MENTKAMAGLRQWLAEPRRRRLGAAAGYGLAGFAMAAGALGRVFQPLALGLVCAAPPGLAAVGLALGAAVGYPVFWGRPGLQGTAWVCLGLVTALALGDRGIVQRQRMLIPAIAAVIVAGMGVVYLYAMDTRTPVALYLLRVAMGVGSSWLFQTWRQERSQWSRWGVQTLGVLALAQIVPMRYLGLGFVAAGYLAARGDWVGGILAGLALDLSQVTDVKMTAVLCAGLCLARLPGVPRWAAMLSCGAVYLPAAMLSGVWDVRPLPGLILGGALAGLLPEPGPEHAPPRPTGQRALTQVQLEQMAQVLRQLEQSLTGVRDPEPDGQAILARCCAESCDTCPERRGCKARALMPGMGTGVLELPGLGEEDLPRGCRKTGRMLQELRRGQEQLRRLKGQAGRLAECRGAVAAQYGDVAEFLEQLSDGLGEHRRYRPPRFQPELGCATRGTGAENGDKCVWFEGRGNRFYLLLCDGMGTGAGAARESGQAVKLIQTMLQAGLAPECALRNVNNLALLRQMGGCVTVDLVEVDLESGKGTVFKWGAPSSYLMTRGQLRKIGTAGPPPGLWQQSREERERLSLGRGEVLILLSDGVSEESLLHSARTTPTQPAGEMAAAILEKACSNEDDATAAVIRLIPCRPGIQ